MDSSSNYSSVPPAAKTPPPNEEAADEHPSLTGNRSTPRKQDIGSQNNQHSGPSSTAHDIDKNYGMFEQWYQHHWSYGWVSEESGHRGSMEGFLDMFVPSDASLPYNSENELLVNKELEIFARAIPKGGLESGSYEKIIQLLDEAQEGFPKELVISFDNTHKTKLAGLTAFDNDTEVDILGGLPGQIPPASNQSWDNFSIAVEVKRTSDLVGTDANNIRRSTEDERGIGQLLQNARSLLFASQSCYVFSIGVYCASQTMRIYRFDHSGSVSCSFNYAEKPELIRKFLWKLVNPRHKIPNTVVGWDETIRIPTQEEVEKMQIEIDRLCPASGLQANRQQSRWIKVKLQCTASRLAAYSKSSSSSGRVENTSTTGSAYGSQDTLYDFELDGFTFGPPLYKSSGLFSRATYVTRIVVNIPGVGHHLFVMKDAWHQRIREPESAFYNRIHDGYSELRTKPEFDWVWKICGDADNYRNQIPGLVDYYGYLDLSTIKHLEQSDNRGHTTVTRRLLEKNETLSERSRCRALTGPVGDRITDFQSTKDLVISIRDAIIGHFIALSCGVLHRDISVGNIIAGNVLGQPRGYLHDFDYATFITPDGRLPTRTDKDDVKDLTGTPQYMAIGVLEKKTDQPYHDLESFYWVIIWIILRHSKHNHIHGNRACTMLFDYQTRTRAISAKMKWFVDLTSLEISMNKPMSNLLTDLVHIFVRSLPVVDGNPPTHREVAETLNKALEGDWPTNDRSCSFTPPVTERLEGVISFRKNSKSLRQASKLPPIHGPPKVNSELPQETRRSARSAGKKPQSSKDLPQLQRHSGSIHPTGGTSKKPRSAKKGAEKGKEKMHPQDSTELIETARLIAEKDGINLAVLGFYNDILTGIFANVNTTDTGNHGSNNIIDVHAHVIPPWYKDIQTPAISHSAKPIPDWDLNAHIAFMNQRGINLSILAFPAPGANVFQGDKVRTIALARLINEQSAAYCRRYPDRLQFYAVVPLPYTTEAITEAHHAISRLGAVGIVLFSNYEGTYLGNTSFKPFFEAINNFDGRQIMYIHPGIPYIKSGDKVIEANPTTYPTGTIELQFEISRVLMDLTLTRTIRDFANIHYIIPHATSALPATIDCILNSVPDIYEASLKFYSTRFWWISQLTEPTCYQQVAIFSCYNIPKSQVIYGTNYPYADVAPMSLASQASTLLTAEEKSAISSTNAKLLFGKSN